LPFSYSKRHIFIGPSDTAATANRVSEISRRIGVSYWRAMHTRQTANRAAPVLWRLLPQHCGRSHRDVWSQSLHQLRPRNGGLACRGGRQPVGYLASRSSQRLVPADDARNALRHVGWCHRSRKKSSRRRNGRPPCSLNGAAAQRSWPRDAHAKKRSSAIFFNHRRTWLNRYCRAARQGGPVVYAPPVWRLIMLVIRHLPTLILNKLDIWDLGYSTP